MSGFDVDSVSNAACVVVVIWIAACVVVVIFVVAIVEFRGSTVAVLGIVGLLFSVVIIVLVGVIKWLALLLDFIWLGLSMKMLLWDCV